MNKKAGQEIDRIVDEIVEDEKKAAELKQRLHDNLDDQKPKFEVVSSESDDGEDMWDNMPV